MHCFTESLTLANIHTSAYSKNVTMITTQCEGIAQCCLPEAIASVFSSSQASFPIQTNTFTKETDNEIPNRNYTWDSLNATWQNLFSHHFLNFSDLIHVTLT